MNKTRIAFACIAGALVIWATSSASTVAVGAGRARATPKLGEAADPLAVTRVLASDSRETVLPIDVPASAPPPAQASRPVGFPDEFFFRHEPWDAERIMSTDALNPRGIELVDRDLASLRAFVAGARDALQPGITTVMRECDLEFEASIADGRARRSARAASTERTAAGGVTVSLSFDAPTEEQPIYTVMQSCRAADGVVYVAGWEDLPRTRAVRQTVAADVLQLLTRLCDQLQLCGLLSPAEHDARIQDVVRCVAHF